MLIHSYHCNSGEPPKLPGYWVFYLSSGVRQMAMPDRYIRSSNPSFKNGKSQPDFWSWIHAPFPPGINRWHFPSRPVSCHHFLSRKTEDPVKNFLITLSFLIERLTNPDQISTCRYCPGTMNPCGSTVTIDRKMELILISRPEKKHGIFRRTSSLPLPVCRNRNCWFSILFRVR